jgi:Ser/Thr protein kinase RdoA (MazF antagonist)
VGGPADNGHAETTLAVIDSFRVTGEPLRSERLSGGHIHRNFLVTCEGGRYVLQRLNDHVFADLDLLLSNVERVAAHMQVSGRRGPRLVETKEGTLWCRMPDGSAWRAFHYLEGTVRRDTISGPDDVFEGARCFADYAAILATLPGPALIPTIDRFHDLHHRMEALDAVASADPVGRRSEARPELDRARRVSRQVADELERRDVGQCTRVVHNDAKLANVRFDRVTGQAACVVDLDTTMPGHIRHDVGELTRTATSLAPEDAGEDSKIDFDLDLLDALASGYFCGFGRLEATEVDTLALGGPEMAVENALRFLTDHLDDDHYFAIDRPDQNLDRGRAQLRLTELMLEAHAEAEACFRRAFRHQASWPPPTSVTDP